jgi:AbrB family looped-hinge helix DNA binding protein
MTLLKILRSAQITLPAELRRKFNLAAGDYLEAQAVKEGILLKPVTVVEREKAWKQVSAVLKEVHAKHPERGLSPREEEEWIAQQVKAFRKEKRLKQQKQHA